MAAVSDSNVDSTNDNTNDNNDKVTTSANSGDVIGGKEASRKSKILKVAQLLFEEKKKDGAMAVLSPTPTDLIQEVLADVYLENPNLMVGCLLDVGCGDGRWLVEFVRSYEGFAVGLDIDNGRIDLAVSSRNQLPLQQRSRIDYILGSFESYNFETASIIVAYLSRFGNDLIKEKILTESMPGNLLITVGVSCTLSCVSVNAVLVSDAGFASQEDVQVTGKGYTCVFVSIIDIDI
jgi:SAM-dependent methyltransferase